MTPSVRKTLGTIARPVALAAGHLFVTGRDLDDTIRACKRYAASGVRCAIGYFNADRETPRSVANVYLQTIDVLAGMHVDGYLSIKVPALDFDATLVEEVIERARSANLPVHFDSHAIDHADRTFAAIERTHDAELGCTLPGRWPRSVDDADFAIARNLRVRVVKGQWADPSHPDLDPSTGFLAVIDRLAGSARRVAVASHDPPLAREALRRLRAARTDCELELLLGLPMRASLRVAKELDVPVRVYVPSGVAWVSYALRHARHNPRVIPWVLRDLTIERWNSWRADCRMP